MEKTNRESRNKNAMKQYESSEEKRINEEKRKFNGMRRMEADKKLRSILFLALGSEGKRVFTQKKTESQDPSNIVLRVLDSIRRSI